jgi:type 1 glutamine amidotransferase
MARAKHPSKDIEIALQELEALGWSVEEPKGVAHIHGGMSCVRPMREMRVYLECFAGCRFGARPETRATMLVS